MNKELPKVFAGKINEELQNDQEVFYSDNANVVSNKVKENKNLSVESKINRIFNSPNYIYKKEVLIKLNDKTIKKVIIGRTNNSLLTFDNNVINIKDIKDIEVV